MNTFIWGPGPDPVETKKPRVITAQFGDGYQQRIGDGINKNPRTWSLKFTRLTADIDAIAAFLDSHAGLDAFVWVPPTGPTGKWICAEWSRRVPIRDLHELTATFVEVFE